MTLEAISFAIGGILIATAIVGGGFEIKEIKMPKVGAGSRFFSLLVGAFFVMIGLGTWSFDRQALLTANATGNALAPGSDQQAGVPSNSTVRTDRSVQQARAEGPADEAVEVAPQAFTGFAGKVRLTWTFDGLQYQAVLKTQQARGFVRVTYDTGAGAWEEVDQDLVFRDSEDGPYYEGVNPRYASTQDPHPEYMPDFFRMAQVDAEHWAYTHVCSADVCEPVTNTEILP